jgi:hypothetical protein
VCNNPNNSLSDGDRSGACLAEADGFRLTMRLVSVFALAVLFSVGGCRTTAPAAESSTPRLELRTEVSSSPVTVTIVVRNPTKQCLSVANAFGYRDLFFRLKIEGPENFRATTESSWELFAEPPYRRLQPGDVLRIEVPLHRWRAMVGGTSASCNGEDCAETEVGPGEHRVRVVYVAPRYENAKDRCPRLRATTESEWKTFIVPGVGG